MKQLLTVIVIFFCIVKEVLSICAEGEFEYATGSCLPNKCLSQYQDLNSNKYDFVSPKSGWFNYNSDTGKLTISYSLIASGTATPSTPDSDCFDLRIFPGKFEKALIETSPAADSLTEVSFYLSHEEIQSFCIFDDKGSIYDSYFTALYQVKGEFEKHIFTVLIDFQVDLPSSTSATVTSFSINGTVLDKQSAGTHTMTIQAIATQTGSAYDKKSGAPARTEIGSEVYVVFELSDINLAQFYAVEFQEARFTNSDGLNIPTLPESTNAINEDVRGSPNQLQLGFLALFPGQMNLEITCMVVPKSSAPPSSGGLRNLEEENSINQTKRIAKTVMKLNVVTEKKATEESDGQNQGKSNSEEENSSNDMFVILMIIAGVFAVLLPASIGYGVYKYNMAKTIKLYEQQIQFSDRTPSEVNVVSSVKTGTKQHELEINI